MRVARVYLPLVYLDQKLWHRRRSWDELESGDYRVRNFFDYEEGVYRDIEP